MKVEILCLTLSLFLCLVLSAPLPDQPAVVIPVVNVDKVAPAVEIVPAVPITPTQSLVNNVDLGLTVFDHSSTSSVDQTKHYVILAFDTDSCSGTKSEHCKKLENIMSEAVGKKLSESTNFKKFESHVVFGKANKDDFPEHKKDFEKAKVSLPAILFWPAGHSRPSCKYDSPDSPSDQFATWLLQKLKEEDDESLIQLDESSSVENKKEKTIVDVSSLVCRADGGPNVVATTDLTCGDLLEQQLPVQQLVELEKTQKIWSFKDGKTKFIGPADNSLPHDTNGFVGDVKLLNSTSYHQLAQQNKWVALYFYAPWCNYCECLDPVWTSVSGNLISSQRQPNLVLGKIDGDSNVDLRTLFNVTVYPTFVVVNKEGTTVLGRYLGPRKAFELSSWIEDLIVAAENPIVKHQFSQSEQVEKIDLNPVYPYSGPAAYVSGDGDRATASQNLVQVSLTGNDFDECLESDEKKFTAPGAALLVHYSSSPSVQGRSLEFDGHSLNTGMVPDKLMVIDFFAPWCPHCQRLNPVWDSLATEVSNPNIVIGKVDVETHSDVKKQFGIKRFPTIMYFPPGQKMTFDENRRYKGERDVNHLKQWISDVSSSSAAAAAVSTAPK